MYKAIFLVMLLASAVFAQDGGIALAPARFELEMKPGSETTVVVNLDYRASGVDVKPARIVASLNDWSLSPDGEVTFFPPNTRPNSAAPWIIYSPGEAPVAPGATHQIRVTVSVPPDAAPGDHMAALIVEQRPDNLRNLRNDRLMVVRYRMASVFYVKVGNLVKRGEFENLTAEATPDGLVVTPYLKNAGNSLLRPILSVTVLDDGRKVVVDGPKDAEVLPILAGSESRPRQVIATKLAVGRYTVKCRVDFQDGRPPIEGVTQVTIESGAEVAGRP